MSTLAQIRNDAGEILKLTGEGQILRSAHDDDMSKAYTEVYAELQGLGLTSWSSTSDVPDKFSHSVAMLVAGARKEKYPVPDTLFQRILSGEGIAMARIRELQAPAKMGVTEIENF